MDNNPPDISVIIATYNVERYIERAVRSALDQHGVAAEIIVVDDGSTDGTTGVVERINDPRITLIRHTGNSGPSVARNAAIAAAHAPWLAILDGDDAFAPDRLMRCLARARQTKADIIVDNLEIHREADGAIYPMFPPHAFARMGMLDLARFIRGNLLMLNGKSLGYLKPIFSAAFLRQHDLRYDPAIRIGEDYRLLAEALACGARCAVEPTAGYHYTVRAGSISHRLTLADVTRMQDSDRHFLARHKLPPAARRAQALRTFSLNEAYHFARLIDALKAKKWRAALAVIAQRPTAALHLWSPIVARLRRIWS